MLIYGAVSSYFPVQFIYELASNVGGGAPVPARWVAGFVYSSIHLFVCSSIHLFVKYAA